MTHHDARAVVGAASGIGDPDRVASVVFGANHVFRLCGGLLLLDQGDVWMAGEGPQLVGRHHGSEAIAEVFQDLTLTLEVCFNGGFARCGVELNIHFPLTANPYIVGHVAGVKLARKLHFRQQGRNEGQTVCVQ